MVRLFWTTENFPLIFIPGVGCYYWKRGKQKWMLAATATGGLCFHKMIHSVLAICFISFFYPSEACDIAYSFWKDGSTLRAGVGELRLVVDMRSCQCHLTLKHSQFLKKIVQDTTVQHVLTTVTPSVSNANEK